MSTAPDLPFVTEPWTFTEDHEIVQLAAASGSGSVDSYNQIRFPWPLVERASGKPFDSGVNRVYATPEAAVAGARHVLGLHLSQQASRARHAQAALEKARLELCEAAQEWAKFDERYPLSK